MKTYQIHLIRTGSTGAVREKMYVGQTDLPLDDGGRHSLLELREQFFYPPVDRVVTSPLSRCVETAEILYPQHDALPDEGFLDMHLGAFQGKRYRELRGDGDFERWIRDSYSNTPPDGEPMEAFIARVVSALDRVFRQMTQEGTGSAAIVTHRGVIMTLLAAVGLPRLPLHEWTVGNGAGYTLRMSADMWLRDRRAEVCGVVPVETGEGDE